MKLAFSIAVLLIACAAIAAPTSRPTKMKWVLAEGAPETLQYVIDRQPEYRKIEVEKITERNKELSRAAHKAKNRDEYKAIKAEIKANEDRINSIGCDEIIVPPQVPPAQVGECGVINGFSIIRVIDDENAVVQVRWPTKQKRAIVTQNRVAHIEETVMIHREFLLIRTDASKWIDGQQILGSRLIFCNDTAEVGARILQAHEISLDEIFIRVPAED